MKFKDKLIKINACNEAIEWVGTKGLKKSWATCEHGDWMMWYVGKNKKKLGLEDMRLITLAKAKCAMLVKHLMRDDRSIKALEVAIQFGNGNATLKQLKDTHAAAYAAAAADDDAAYAAYTDAAYAAYTAAADAAYAAYTAAADAAYAAAAAADDAAADADAYVAYYAADAYAADAAHTDDAAADADAYAADAAHTAAAADAARKETLLKCADICREVFKDVIK